MKILITGSQGFIGNSLVRYFIERNHYVIGIDNLSTNEPMYYEKQFSDYNFRIGDINNISLEFIIRDVDLVIHAAAIARIPNSNKRWYEYYYNNVLSTLKIINLCKVYKTKVIYISSSSVLSNQKLSAYSETKLIGENICQYNSNCNIVRLFNVFGENMPMEGENSTLIGRLLYAMNNKGSINIYGKGNKKRDFTYINDVCKAIDLIISSKEANSVFNIGTGTNYSIIDVVKASGVNYNIKDSLKYEALITKAENTNLLKLGWNSSINIIDFLKYYDN